jgi:Uma2 family endonuclease
VCGRGGERVCYDVSEVVFAGIDLMVNTQIRPLTVDDYHQMIETGIIHEGEHTELISGQIFNMAAKGTRHTVANTELMGELLLLLGRRAKIRCQDPISLPNNSEPEPDIVITKLRADNYVKSHPIPADIILVIEVADSTLNFDRNTKAPLYATAGINEYWIVNLVDDRLEIYSQPEGTIYTNTQIVLPPRLVSIPQFPEITLDLTTIFPPKI